MLWFDLVNELYRPCQGTSGSRGAAPSERMGFGVSLNLIIFSWEGSTYRLHIYKDLIQPPSILLDSIRSILELDPASKALYPEPDFHINLLPHIFKHISHKISDSISKFEFRCMLEKLVKRHNLDKRERSPEKLHALPLTIPFGPTQK
ncbi:hypothetical protein VNO77_03126 [Canavalia gladiata]|uniref:Uncharacterized protein n=1 Tax=Canavalia gladiata TaxID=3824 RepID=A0AAN9MUB2_CANGL